LKSFFLQTFKLNASFLIFSAELSPNLRLSVSMIRGVKEQQQYAEFSLTISEGSYGKSAPLCIKMCGVVASPNSDMWSQRFRITDTQSRHLSEEKEEKATK
jgi:hypothetical protein